MSETPAARKRELRRELRERRRSTSVDECRAASERIAAKLRDSIDWSAVRTLHVYRSVASWREIDTEQVVRDVRERAPQVEVVLADVSRDQPVPTRPFDVIVVPVLGFDDDNFRLGLGAGFYDRFLAGQARARKIGLAYAWGRVANGLPREPHDVPLDLVLTDAPR